MLKPNSITLVGSELVRSWFEPDSVINFGFYRVTLRYVYMALISLQACRIGYNRKDNCPEIHSLQLETQSALYGIDNID